MMATVASSGLWLLVILNGAINGYPTEKALDPLGASSTNPSFGSTGEELAPGFFHAESAFPTTSNPVVQLRPVEQSFHPSAPKNPVPALYGSDVYPAPVYQGSKQPRFQSPPNRVQWAVAPPTPFSGRGSSPGESSFVSEIPGYVSPPGPFSLLFQPGEAAYEEKMYEQGEYNSESEDKGPPAQYFPVHTLNEHAIGSPLALGILVARLQLGYPLMEYMLLSKRYPPGTYTHSTNQLEHRKNQWRDSHHIGHPYRSGHKQLEMFFP
ncbi:hypothetical protein CHARACLAT_026376 [Characodon lateralis]|uniref:Uncharacterized protein n=1 Tax=Characodon lateralis TaxID=208331 RepID=A0ABU7EG91_9TELE|nr:hypothetical protein [Characodon lateralis]